MISRPSLLTADLRRQLTALESDLRSRSAEPDIDRTLRSKWQAMHMAARISASYESWRDDQVTQGAAAWLLGTVFLRFCEDNDLISAPYLAGRGERLALAEQRQRDFCRANPHASDPDWIMTGLREIRTNPVAVGLRDLQHSPTRWPEISDRAAGGLIAFWRTRRDGEPVYDFTDPERRTDFLGDLYQDLSEDQRSKYALLETPDFIAEFTLDRTLEPAIKEFGLAPLRIIDPVCGSGTFLLSAFWRLIDHWRNQAVASAPWDLVGRVLTSIHGVDKNPIAVSIARFRLTIAAMKAGGARQLIDAPDLRIIVATGDSLLHGRGAPEPADHMVKFDVAESYDQRWEGGDEFKDADILGACSYHVVVGNPPYTTPKDKAESEAYRAAYPVSIGAYALTVPFIVRFFGLAVRGDDGGSGYVGLLAANSLMKREFGRRLIEQFFPTVDLTYVIDTAGVFIPGHGSPTTILLGRAQRPQRPTAKAIIGLRGEPQVPPDPAQGRVWRSILNGIDHIPYEDGWTQGLVIDRSTLSVFPWSLADPATVQILHQMERGMRLRDRVTRIGYFANTGSDDLFTAPPESFRRISAEIEPLIPVITGSEVRDWRVVAEADGALFSEKDKRSPSIEQFPHLLRRLWPYRTVLGNRRNYSGRSYFEDGRPWYSWHHVAETPGTHRWSIVFPWVNTHTHFAVLRERAAPLNSAPIIRLPRTASDSDVLQLTALLNSSLVCFWLKHYSNSKGQPRVDQTGTGEPWTLFYEFTGTRLADLPLPADRWSNDRWSVHAEQLDQLAQELTATDPQVLLRPDAVITAAGLDAARTRWEKAHAGIVSLQEELDWEIYGRYGLLSDAGEFLTPDDTIPDVMVGERAFEIVLARRIARGETFSTWFERHGVKPVTELPRRWPARYRQVIEKRIEAIEQRPGIGLVERPEFKRRWAAEPWETREKDAIRRWLLDRCEGRNLWYEADHRAEPQPRPLTINRLAARLRGEEGVLAMASRYAGEGSDLAAVVTEIIQGEHVPYLAALRYEETGLRKYAQWEQTWHLQREEDETGRHLQIPVPPKYTPADFIKPAYWKQRRKFDIPNERFISYPFAARDGELIIGWAGWNHSERARVLISLIERHKRAGDNASQFIMPLLAGLRELVIWLMQWHSQPESPFWEDSPANEVRAYLERQKAERGLQDKDLTAWRPTRPKRGRPRKTPAHDQDTLPL